jgi:hypothetical protein
MTYISIFRLGGTQDARLLDQHFGTEVQRAARERLHEGLQALWQTSQPTR